jgi:hypothetical protein
VSARVPSPPSRRALGQVGRRCSRLLR